MNGKPPKLTSTWKTIPNPQFEAKGVYSEELALPHQSHTKPTPRPHQGHTKATPRPPKSHRLATCKPVASGVLSYSLRILMVFSWCFHGVLHSFFRRALGGRRRRTP